MWLVPILIVCAVLLLLGGVLLLLAVVALWMLMREAEQPNPAHQTYIPVRPSPPGPQPLDSHLDAPDDDAAKTEVFMRRGSMNLDWDDDGGEDATELFRSEIHGVGHLDE